MAVLLGDVEVGGQRWELSSPGGDIVVVVVLDAEGKAWFSISYRGSLLFERCRLGLTTSMASFVEGLHLAGERRRVVEEHYELTGAKAREAWSKANELVLSLAKGTYALEVRFWASDEGAAFCYEVPGRGQVAVYGEESSWQLAGDVPWRSWCQAMKRNYEGFYTPRQGLPAGELNMPLLLHKPGTAWVLLSEAAVYGSACGSHLRSDPATAPGVLKVVPAEDQVSAVVAEAPVRTPWRVAVVSSELAGLVESLLVEHLSPACELDDTSWARPGRVYWSWWAGEAQEELGPHLAYVDAAAKLGFEYYLADAGWQEAWLDALVSAAASKGIGVFVWFHHRELLTQEAREAWFSRLSQKGVRGVKVDFFDSDSQDRIRLYDELARATARYKLLLNYHGATKPAGERRRWPHLLTREAVYGAEYYKFQDGPTAEHNCTLPFTRNVVGPMDYTPLVISNCRAQTSLGHQLALPVVFESGLQHLSDPPGALQRYGEGLELLARCPTAWDETRLVAGVPGQLVVLARRAGREWFIGAISALDEEHAVDVPLGFLGPGRYRARSFEDGPEGIVASRQEALADATLRLRLGRWGGAAAWVAPA